MTPRRYGPDPPPPAAELAERRPRRAVGQPEIVVQFGRHRGANGRPRQ